LSMLAGFVFLVVSNCQHLFESARLNS